MAYVFFFFVVPAPARRPNWKIYTNILKPICFDHGEAFNEIASIQSPAHANPYQLFEFIGAHGVAIKRPEIRTEAEKKINL